MDKDKKRQAPWVKVKKQLADTQNQLAEAQVLLSAEQEQSAKLKQDNRVLADKLALLLKSHEKTVTQRAELCGRVADLEAELNKHWWQRLFAK